MVADPQGAPFYVMKPNPPADNPDAESDVFSPDKAGRCGWNELQTSDTDAARRFYGDQFGWGSDEYMDMGEMGDYRFWITTAAGSVRCSTQMQRTTAALALLLPRAVDQRREGDCRTERRHDPHGPTPGPHRRLGGHRFRPAGRGVRARRRGIN